MVFHALTCARHTACASCIQNKWGHKCLFLFFVGKARTFSSNPNSNSHYKYQSSSFRNSHSELCQFKRKAIRELQKSFYGDKRRKFAAISSHTVQNRSRDQVRCFLRWQQPKQAKPCKTESWSKQPQSLNREASNHNPCKQNHHRHQPQPLQTTNQRKPEEGW